MQNLDNSMLPDQNPESLDNSTTQSNPFEGVIARKEEYLNFILS